MYHSLCSDDYNKETIRMIDEDPQCQIIIATIAFSNGINAKSILDSIFLGFSSTLDIVLQEKGRAGRGSGSLARGVILVQPTITAAAKQLQGISFLLRGQILVLILILQVPYLRIPVNLRRKNLRRKRKGDATHAAREGAFPHINFMPKPTH
jgi:hypothetical protein